MGWLVGLAAIGLIVFLILRSVDRETGRNLSLLAKIILGVIGVLILVILLSVGSRGGV